MKCHYRMVRCQSRILEKMVNMVLSSNSLMVTVLKWRKKRGVTGFLPPPAHDNECTHEMHCTCCFIHSVISELFTSSDKTKQKFWTHQEDPWHTWSGCLLSWSWSSPSCHTSSSGQAIVVGALLEAGLHRFLLLACLRHPQTQPDQNHQESKSRTTFFVFYTFILCYTA